MVGKKASGKKDFPAAGNKTREFAESVGKLETAVVYFDSCLFLSRKLETVLRRS